MSRFLTEHVLTLAQSQPEKPALLFKKEVLSYRELADRLVKCGAVLSGLGIRRGDRVLFTALSKLETVVIYLGIQFIGAVAVCVDKKAAQETGWQIYSDTEASLYITDKPCGEYAGRMRLYSLRKLYHACGEVCGEVCADSVSLPSYVRPDGEDIAEMIFTTGTTGKPKGVMLSYRAVYQISKNTIDGIGILTEDRILIPLPLNHSLALRELRGALWQGAAVVLQNGFTFAMEMEKNITELKCTGMVIVPASLELTRSQMQDRFSRIVGKLRYIEVGAGSLTVQQRKEFSALLPDTKLINTWGSSETGGALFTNVNEVVKNPVQIAAIGKPLSGVAVSMLDADGQEMLHTDHDHPGRLALKGDMVMSGYWNRELETKNALRDGWLVTNDITYTDEDGYVYMLGRADDIINVGGEKVSPIEVENLAGEFPAIRECACIGVPDPEQTLGQVPVLFIVKRTGFSLNELKKYLSARMERFKIPQDYVMVPELPRNSMKKPDRKAMRSLWEQQVSSDRKPDHTESDIDRTRPSDADLALNVILTRRSIRRFTNQAVPEALLERILEAGLHAPSGHNLQTWQFTVVKQPEQIQRLKTAAKASAAAQNVGCYGFENPACLILVSNDNRNPNSCQDASCAAENMLLSAHALGLGACWLNVLRTLREIEPVKSVLDAYGVPAGHTVWSMIALGYPAEEPKKLTRKRSVIHMVTKGLKDI